MIVCEQMMFDCNTWNYLIRKLFLLDKDTSKHLAECKQVIHILKKDNSVW